ncbi:MAG: PEP-CTERM sorting domain-containing protein [Pseudomonadota bacterium]
MNTADIIARLNDGTLKVRLHVQALPKNDGNESFVNNRPPQEPDTEVPEPGTMILLGLGFIGITGISRLRTKV